MNQNNELGKAVAAALEVEPRVDLHRNPIEIRVDGGEVTLSGLVEDVAAWRRALLAASRVPGVEVVHDRLCVKPVQEMGDGEIADHLRDALYEEPAFCEYDLNVIDPRTGEAKPVRHLGPAARGTITASVSAAAVTLRGEVQSLSHRRLAGVLAWWVPGVCAVSNELVVEPPEEDSDEEIRDAVRLVLEKNRFVDVTGIRVACRDGVVTLSGTVPNAGQARLAENDAWYVAGVVDVVNELVAP